MTKPPFGLPATYLDGFVSGVVFALVSSMLVGLALIEVSVDTQLEILAMAVVLVAGILAYIAAGRATTEQDARELRLARAQLDNIFKTAQAYLEERTKAALHNRRADRNWNPTRIGEPPFVVRAMPPLDAALVSKLEQGASVRDTAHQTLCLALLKRLNNVAAMNDYVAEMCAVGNGIIPSQRQMVDVVAKHVACAAAMWTAYRYAYHDIDEVPHKIAQDRAMDYMSSQRLHRVPGLKEAVLSELDERPMIRPRMEKI